MVNLILEIEFLDLPEKVELRGEEDLIKLVLANRNGIRKIKEEWVE